MFKVYKANIAIPYLLRGLVLGPLQISKDMANLFPVTAAIGVHSFQFSLLF